MNLADVHRFFDPYRSLLGDEWDAFCETCTRPLPATFWVNPTKVPIERVIQSFREDGYDPHPYVWMPSGFEIKLPPTSRTGKLGLGRRFENKVGWIHLQESASFLPPLILDPQPGELVLDLCAAPGGKSAQIASMMNNQGTLIVNDINFDRLRAVRATQERLGLYNLVLCSEDGQTFLADEPPCFDRVLVDVPCSCEGTIRKHKKWRFHRDLRFKKNVLFPTQKRLLMNALRLTKIGGVVVYSTCTLDPDENEKIIH